MTLHQGNASLLYSSQHLPSLGFWPLKVFWPNTASFKAPHPWQQAFEAPRYEDPLRCGTLGADIPVRCQDQLIAYLLHTQVFRLIQKLGKPRGPHRLPCPLPWSNPFPLPLFSTLNLYSLSEVIAEEVNLYSHLTSSELHSVLRISIITDISCLYYPHFLAWWYVLS